LFEDVLDAAIAVKKLGWKNVSVTNGFIDPAPLNELFPVIDAMNSDVKRPPLPHALIWARELALPFLRYQYVNMLYLNLKYNMPPKYCKKIQQRCIIINNEWRRWR